MLKQSTTHHFEDTEFLSKNILEHEGRDVFWLRPSDVSHFPIFSTDLNTSFCFNESLSLDSYQFLCVAAALKKQNKLPVRPAFSSSAFGECFNGRLEAKFYRNNIECAFNVDDLLPYTNFQGNFAAVFSYSLNSNEFWISYVEKAYTKFLGSHSMVFKKSMYDLVTEMSGCFIEKLRTKYRIADYEVCVRNVKILMREYECFGLAKVDQQWILFEKSKKGEEDIDMYPLRYDNRPMILENLKLNPDTGEMKPIVDDIQTLLREVDDILFCWYPSPKMFNKHIIGYWMCGKNSGGPHFEPTYHINPQIKLSVHEDFPEEDDEEIKNQILIQVELLRPYYGSIAVRVFKAAETREGIVMKRLPARLLGQENVYVQGESTEKFQRPWVTLRIPYARDGDVFFIIPSLPEMEMCGGFRIKVLSSVVISDLEECKGLKAAENVEKCRKKTCVKL